MRNGIKVIDTDTHMNASAETIEPYLAARFHELVPNLDSHKVPITKGMGGAPRSEPYKHRLVLTEDGGDDGSWSATVPRTLGEAEPRVGEKRRNQKFRGVRYPTDGGQEYADIRLKDMDEEGVDAQVVVPGTSLAKNGSKFWNGTWNGSIGVEILMEFISAVHRHLNDMCGAAPHRLSSLLLVTPLDVERSVEEINHWGSSDWAVGIWPHLPLDYPIDHPDMNPIWAAAQANNLALIHHSPNAGYPGYRDLWNNPFLGRSASHPWAAMRFVAAVAGSGMLDRFPELRFGILESGFGWLPFWARRLDDQLDYMGYGAEDLKLRPSEYLTGGRFFASIEMHEGPDMMKTVCDLMGDDILMLGTDYPHAESYFPKSVDHVLEWENHGISASAIENLLWKNAVKCFGEP